MPEPRKWEFDGNRFEEITLTKWEEIKPGDILRTHYADDMIVYSVTGYSKGVLLGVVIVYHPSAAYPYYKREDKWEIPFGYQVTFNRTHEKEA